MKNTQQVHPVRGPLWRVALILASLVVAPNAFAWDGGGGRDSDKDNDGGSVNFNPPADHTDQEDGFYHRPGKERPFSNSCTSCHGVDLTGGIAPSCYTCHGQEWDEEQPPAPPPPPPGSTPDGAALYAANCAGCHNPLATSTKAGRTADQISGAIANTAFGMGGLSGLTAEEIAAIADALGGGGTTPPPATTMGCLFNPPADHTDEEDNCLHQSGKDNPFSNGCTACHGADLMGGFAPSCFTCHGQEWDENLGGGGDDGDDSDDGYDYHSRGGVDYRSRYGDRDD